ncbi:hypothetical protein AAFF_G00259340 [Aldrovandia affinis]|uniref:Beta-ketoacyl synthase-like N-terminal domain-containing protein n=1 Tax=Aldrovandia affinis TaxID=143900 RepID=A0AAD7STV6_9TELE|nr:hypothetical protein AAFF_G00259340 [Aldrovandia affinis]
MVDREEDIAVVGIGCNFPGGEGLDNFWKVLLEGKNCTVQIPEERFNSALWYDADNSKAGKTHTTKAALIGGSKDGRALLSDEEQEARWVEHFREVLNQPTPPTLFNLDQEPPAPTLNITSDEISGIEVDRAIKSLKNNKVPGPNEVSTELLKHGREVVVESLTHLFNLIWHSEDVSAYWRSGVIVTLPKKGNQSDCNNWQGITLLSIPGKVFCSVLLQCLKTEVDNILREEQAGFRKVRSCSEQIFTLRNIIEPA